MPSVPTGSPSVSPSSIGGSTCTHTLSTEVTDAGACGRFGLPVALLLSALLLPLPLLFHRTRRWLLVKLLQMSMVPFREVSQWARERAAPWANLFGTGGHT